MEPSRPVFPCETFPADPRTARLLGLYEQAQAGRWMQRVKITGGRVTAPQWRALAAIARGFTPRTPLHLTTRQDLEFHDLSAGQVPPLQRALEEVQMTGLGACGDTIRNVTVCPCSGVAAGKPELEGLALEIRKLLENAEGAFALPRKFKVSLSACQQACGQPWINDLGLVYQAPNGRHGFAVIAGGSLGPRPATGIMIADFLAPEDVLPLCLAAVRTFQAHGDRNNRAKARLRHVRQRVGDEAFTRIMLDTLAAVKAERPWPRMELDSSTGVFPDRLILTFPNGDVTPDAADAMGELAGRGDLAARIANDHRIIVFGRDPFLRDAVRQSAALRSAAEEQPSVVACPGRRWCKRALTDTNDLADRIRMESRSRLSPQTTVCISGCPNNCAHSAVADIGLIGVIDSRDGQRREAYDLLRGGQMGRTGKLAEPVGRKLSAAEVLKRLASA